LNIEYKKLLFVGFLEHYKKEILKTSANYGLDSIMEDLEERVKDTRKEFME